ncbi:zinc ABC transporter ATP-binding protein AztA [Biostraticola tofi]|uniref:Zinc/manganese transport system ATP-binding protein n=1 Tax=Biostraticola tofi TaxID=466109 RepID=A0A4R3Z7B3_9GAMM|nr:zinc ABC transporter ATP-binding protein AztA [Biostraticola tofi]TCW00101.1 zinc/manganese transport system ATP-binding protein [Biostraticola tofi]
MRNTAVQLTDLTLGYERVPAIKNINGELLTGSLTALIGPNGSGKSTLLKGIAGILPPLCGSCCVNSAQRVAYLPQSSALDCTFPANVLDLVSLGLWPQRGLRLRHRAEDRQRVANALQAVGLDGFGNRSLSALSGGQLQRALFARVILQDAGIILLDEPFNAIDGSTRLDLLRLIKQWHAQQRTILVVIHDIALVSDHFPQTIFVNGELMAWGETQTVLQGDLPLPSAALANAGRFTLQRVAEQ